MNKIKEIILNENKIKYLIIMCFIIILLFIFFMIFRKTDGMEQAGIDNISYRVYSSDGWSKWKKNGLTNGNKKDEIKKVEIKLKNDLPNTEYYYNKKWNKENKNNNQITGFRIINSAYYLKKYDVCYRTYNSKNKWLNWSCNGNLSGNINEPITALEIKVIPRDVIKTDYLKDYILNNKKMIGF